MGLEEEEPWKAGWVPRSQLRGDPGYEEGGLDLLEIPMWLIRDKGWHLPPDEPEPETTSEPAPATSATDLTLEELRAAGIEVTLILPGDIL